MSPQGLFLSALLRGLSVVGFKGRERSGSALGTTLPGLLLGMDPQLNWFKVVAGNKPLLPRSIGGARKREQRCRRQQQCRTPRDVGEGWGNR